MSALADRASASLARLSHVVTRPEGRGWVTREASGRDARATNAVLTAAASEKVADTAPHHAQAVRDLVVDALSPAQFRQFGISARKIARRVEERAPAPKA
jgi:DNA-binding MarR family transcriptional regulator